MNLGIFDERLRDFILCIYTLSSYLSYGRTRAHDPSPRTVLCLSEQLEIERTRVKDPSPSIFIDFNPMIDPLKRGTIFMYLFPFQTTYLYNYVLSAVNMSLKVCHDSFYVICLVNMNYKSLKRKFIKKPTSKIMKFIK